MINIEANYEAGPVRLGLVRSTFPGGEEHIQLEAGEAAGQPQSLIIRALLTGSAEVMALMLTTDALRRRFPGVPVRLEMPYVPYARQDRVCNPGEALGLRVLCDLINAQGYESVHIRDPHSEVATALIDRVVVQDLVPVLARVVSQIPGVVLVSPDAGAQKRVAALAQRLGGLPVIQAQKVRDPRGGRIAAVSVDLAEVRGRSLLVVDDICDGGRTFLELGKVLQGADVPLHLYVTHGIFSRGVEQLLTIYQTIFTQYDWSNSRSDRVVLI